MAYGNILTIIEQVSNDWNNDDHWQGLETLVGGYCNHFQRVLNTFYLETEVIDDNDALINALNAQNLKYVLYHRDCPQGYVYGIGLPDGQEEVLEQIMFE